MYQLKKNQPPFEMVDGPHAGQRFGHGIDYKTVPYGYEYRFDYVEQETVKTYEPQPAESLPVSNKKSSKADRQEVTNAE